MICALHRQAIGYRVMSCKTYDAFKLLCDFRKLFSLKSESPVGPPARSSGPLAASDNAERQNMMERIMVDFGTQTDFESQTPLVPVAKTIELKETIKATVSKVSVAKFPLIGG